MESIKSQACITRYRIDTHAAPLEVAAQFRRRLERRSISRIKRHHDGDEISFDIFVLRDSEYPRGDAAPQATLQQHTAKIDVLHGPMIAVELPLVDIKIGGHLHKLPILNPWNLCV